MPRERLLISGLVQGVGFRYHARAEGQRLGLKGWVRNLPDGRVEALAEGEPGALAAFRAWCQEGPPAARVDQVAAAPEAGQEPLGPFEVRRG